MRSIYSQRPSWTPHLLALFLGAAEDFAEDFAEDLAAALLRLTGGFFILIILSLSMLSEGCSPFSVSPSSASGSVALGSSIVPSSSVTRA